MKIIRALILATLIGSIAFLRSATSVSAQGLFVQQVIVPKVQATVSKVEDKTPESELKQVIPLAFPDTKVDNGKTNEDTVDLFAPIYVDNDRNVIQKNITVEKSMPLDPENITGVSTYFSRFHPGLDYRAKLGTPIYSVLPGIVNEVGFQSGGYGRYIVLVHYTDGKILFSLYAHLKDTKVKVGDEVDSGTEIGYVGLTGRSTGPHLHFELHDTKSAMDPVRFFANKSLAMVMKK